MVEIEGLVLDNVDNGQYGAMVYIGDADGKRVYTAPEGIARAGFDGEFKIKAPDDVFTSGNKYIYSKDPDGGKEVKKQELRQYTSYKFVWNKKKAQELDSVTVTAKSNATLCKEKGGTYLESTKQCKMPPRFKTAKINWKKRLFIGGIVLIVMGTATYFIVKKLRN